MPQTPIKDIFAWTCLWHELPPPLIWWLIQCQVNRQILSLHH